MQISLICYLCLSFRSSFGVFFWGLLFFFLFGVFFLSLLSLSLSPFPRLLSHRIIIRQIRLSAASLPDMPSLACGASPVFPTPPPSLAYTVAYPTRLVKSSGLPAPQAFHPNTLAFLPAPHTSFILSPLAFRPSPLFCCLHRFYRCADSFWLFSGYVSRIFYVRARN